MKRILLFGPSGSGKTTYARALKKALPDLRVIILDGDELRATINSDLGFSDDDILENMRRIKGLTDWIESQDLADVVIAAVIAPFKLCRTLLSSFHPFYLYRPQCYSEDLKGLYRSGKQRVFEEGDEERIDNSGKVDLSQVIGYIVCP